MRRAKTEALPIGERRRLLSALSPPMRGSRTRPFLRSADPDAAAAGIGWKGYHRMTHGSDPLLEKFINIPFFAVEMGCSMLL